MTERKIKKTALSQTIDELAKARGKKIYTNAELKERKKNAQKRN